MGLIHDEAGVAALKVVKRVIVWHHPLHRAALSTEEQSILFLAQTTLLPDRPSCRLTAKRWPAHRLHLLLEVVRCPALMTVIQVGTEAVNWTAIPIRSPVRHQRVLLSLTKGKRLLLMGECLLQARETTKPLHRGVLLVG